MTESELSVTDALHERHSVRAYLDKPVPETLLRRVIDAARETGGRAHILHLSSADALPQIAAAKAEGIKLTVETCPHYLVFSAEEIPDGSTAHKCCPPIREESNREALWQGLADGTIDCIVSDHSPSTAELKLLDTGDFGAAWGGIASVQLTLPIIWTEARRRGIDLEQVVQWMATKPADRVGLRLNGEVALERSRTGELPSEGAVTGALQVPPSGQPVLFGPDHPLTGGYPIIASIVDTDLAAQLPPGVKLCFTTADRPAQSTHEVQSTQQAPSTRPAQSNRPGETPRTTETEG